MPVYQLHTYGCPRVGNAAFAKYLNERLASSSGVWRIVSFHDPFTHVPQKSLGYEHYSQEVWFNSRDLSNINKYKVCTGNEDSSCSSSVNTLLYNPMDHMSYLGVDMNADCPR
jgi:predicted lipase